MKKIYFISIFITIFSSINASAQGLVDVELYGGPIQTYLREGSGINASGYESQNPITAHLGINLLTRITDNWQITLQSELFRVTQHFTGEIMGQRREQNYGSRHFGNFALGARYSVLRGKNEFFFQPSFGILPYTESNNNFLYYESQRKTSVTLRGEAGIKVYNKRENYFVFGLRYQQGLNRLQQHDFSDMTFSQYGSYTGLVIGYGINSRKGLR